VKQKGASEFDKFNATMNDLLKVSHDEIKAKLAAEKDAKEKGRKPPEGNRK
jgi:hypothetical protein